MGRIVATDVVSVQPTGIVDQCVTVDSPGDAASLLESAGIDDTLELNGSHPLASPEDMRRLLDAADAYNHAPTAHAGGSASNVLRAVASFGASARLVGARGDDSDGDLYERSVRAAGICTEHLMVKKGRKTATCCVISGGEQRTMRTMFAETARLEVRELRKELLAGSKFLFVSSYNCLFEGMIERLISLGSEAGCAILLDLGSFEIVKRFSGRLDGLFRSVDFCVCNEDEAAAFAKIHFPVKQDTSDGSNRDNDAFDATAAWMFEHGVRSAVIVTLGERGSILYEPSEHAQAGLRKTLQPAVRLAEGAAVDPTGAGDAFCGGLLYGLSRGMGLHEAIEMASAAGAAAVMSRGAQLSEDALSWWSKRING